MMRAVVSRILQTLLLVSVAACAEDEAATVLRFYVYSDVPLTGVQVTVLGGDSGKSEYIGVEQSIAPGELLFWFAVQVTAESKVRDRATVEFAGYPIQSGKTQIVVRQTVTAQFSRAETESVRVRLSSACAQASIESWCQGKTCDGATGRCEQTVDLLPVSDVDLDRWEPAMVRSCGPCPYGACADGGCAPTDTWRPLAQLGDGADVETSSGFMRRVIAQGELAAVGILSPALDTTFRLFVAEDNGRIPGAILETGLATVQVRDGDRRAELLLAHRLPKSQAVWIGYQVLDDTATVHYSGEGSGEGELVVMGMVPPVGQSFSRFLPDGTLVPAGSLTPAIYTVFIQ